MCPMEVEELFFQVGGKLLMALDMRVITGLALLKFQSRAHTKSLYLVLCNCALAVSYRRGGRLSGMV